MQNACCLFGHRDLNKNIGDELRSVLERLITEKQVETFYTGGMGNADAAFSSAVRCAKREHPEIKLILVKPYFSNELNTNKEYYETAYDEIIIPNGLVDVHYKSAIEKRNRWMIEQSLFVISCVYKNYGGAYSAIRYAENNGKMVLHLSCAKK